MPAEMFDCMPRIAHIIFVCTTELHSQIELTFIDDFELYFCIPKILSFLTRNV